MPSVFYLAGKTPTIIAPTSSSSNFITSTIWNWKNKIDTYFNLSEVNKQLADENAVLKEMLLNKEILLGKNFIKSGDSLFVKAFKFQEATIIQSQFKFF